MGSATGRPQGEHAADSQPELVLRDDPVEPAGPGQRPRPAVAARGHQTWASRFASGQGGSAGAGQHAGGRGTGWEVLSYLLAGMATYGGLGWVIGHFTHIQIFFPIGLLAGVAISLSWIVYKYGRQK